MASLHNRIKGTSNHYPDVGSSKLTSIKLIMIKSINDKYLYNEYYVVKGLLLVQTIQRKHLKFNINLTFIAISTKTNTEKYHLKI